MNQRIYQYLPQIGLEEAMMIESFTQQLSDDEMRYFAGMYASRRRDPLLILLLALIGFLGINGVHRFVIGQIGMGILYLLTGGLCLIGTIVDLVNHKQLALDYNRKIASEILMMIKPNSTITA
ncbi:MAG TPA: TM2 domain-containing protein [Bacteroidales bacterium]|jgi:TM2 domain-containing membrane protein YozV|nr:TM2 domain-containing protein [Bacteroidales bacterium]MDI9573058.1 TM2 domain-containing protein [Bacteroidota bacterium]MBP9511630.1 TM2 domain-containing protein [Bacteroidales bacterium]MBP9588106.1 TM2 domain-containing protein [Bacteroidales bacterium]NMD16115.1 TM2 domain-containing protein [Bacteroidales bacterium]